MKAENYPSTKGIICPKCKDDEPEIIKVLAESEFHIECNLSCTDCGHKGVLEIEKDEELTVSE